ncbi:phosphoribosylformylglycinamidine synthase subunit PurQ [Micrococcoides hystricis]|uniref:Phosphoribosylformylglycinamidine synthase subunit PurQ n=1 Tax=Micrococcoides hystricis TaxID=1572761 RepID=A0ABV6PC47_9MICC
MTTELPLVGDYSTDSVADSGLRVGVAVFPGTLGDRDITRALTRHGIEAVQLWHRDTDLQDVDAVILPGGSSYGDYLRPGALAANAPLIKAIKAGVEKGLAVLGTGNGFQILTEAGLLPGAFKMNDSARYHNSAETLTVANNSTAFTKDFSKDERIVLPLSVGYGNYWVDEATAAELAENNQIVLRYAENPHGSTQAIAGVANREGNVVGLLPQAEYAIEAGFGPSTDGARVFTSLLSSLAGGK